MSLFSGEDVPDSDKIQMTEEPVSKSLLIKCLFLILVVNEVCFVM